MHMQINLYNANIKNEFLSERTGEEKAIPAWKKNNFFGIAIEKSESLPEINGNYMNYDKNGSEKDSSMEKDRQISQSRQDVTAYINENLDKLKQLVTEEDYSAMSELGLAADKENPDTLVTVYERIQIGLAAYSDNYDTWMSGISEEKIQEVLGSQAMAQAVKMAEDIGSFGEETKAYLLKNNLEPTIENVYKAAHSTSSGNQTAKDVISEQEWETLKPQIAEVMQKYGLDVNEENMQNAEMLIQNRIPVTGENLVKLQELNQADFTKTDVLLSNITFAVMMGMKGTDAFITSDWISPTEIQDTLQAVEQATDEVVYDIVKDGAVLNAANLKRYEQNSQNQGEQQEERDLNDVMFLRAKKVVVEAKLVMTSSSLMTMQKLGVSITYTEISVVSDLITEENDNAARLYFDHPEVAKEQLSTVSGVMEFMKEMNQVPSVLMGQIYQEQLDFTLSDIFEGERNLSVSMRQAEITYEAVGTQIRKDLGDSIYKAFDSIDGILQEQKIDLCESSRRAARILAHNQMEINQESVRKMESLMMELDYVRDNLTPKTAAVLVENQVDILNTDIRELNQNLIQLNEMIHADYNENFAKYLWKLEKSGKISEEERDRYVDLYRTLNQIESLDSSALGAVVLQGTEMTLNHLLTAVKSRKKTGMDITLDETAGFRESENEQQNTDLQNIGEFVKKMAVEISGGITAHNVENLYQNGAYGGISLDVLLDVVRNQKNQEENRQLNTEYTKEVMDEYLAQIKEKGISEDAVMTLLEGGHKVSVEHLLSAAEFVTPGSELRKYLMEKKRKIQDDFEQSETPDDITDTWEELKEDTDKLDISYEKMKAVLNMNRHMEFAVQGAKNESYHIPMELGDEIVPVRVSFVSGEDQGKAEISMNTAKYGKIDCVIRSVNMVSHVKTEAVVYCEYEISKHIITGSKAIFTNEIKNVDDTCEFHMEVADQRVHYDMNRQDEGESSSIDNVYLFKISKSFLKSVKECLDSNR